MPSQQQQQQPKQSANKALDPSNARFEKAPAQPGRRAHRGAEATLPTRRCAAASSDGLRPPLHLRLNARVFHTRPARTWRTSQSQPSSRTLSPLLLPLLFLPANNAHNPLTFSTGRRQCRAGWPAADPRRAAADYCVSFLYEAFSAAERGAHGPARTTMPPASDRGCRERSSRRCRALWSPSGRTPTACC